MQSWSRGLLLVYAVSLTSAAAPAGAAGNEFAIESGTATFEAATNVPGVEVKGKSTALTGHLSISRDDRGIVAEDVDLVVPVKTLSTGMNVRDEHMRKYIFTADDAQLPDIRFVAENLVCPAASSSQDFACVVKGRLSFRGTAHAFEMTLHVKTQAGTSPAFRASGDAIVKLTEYGIKPPSQFGVSTTNDVKLHLDFNARQKPGATASAERSR